MAFLQECIALDPAELRELSAAFDSAWSVLKGDIPDSRGAGEARTRLALIVLDLAKLGQLGPDQMSASAVRIYREEQDKAGQLLVQ